MSPSDPAPTLDDETTAALTLFNEYVEADRERTQREKRVKKAERAKDEAAARVKQLDDKGVTGDEKSEAEQAYRAAVDTWKALRDGKEPPAPSPGPRADEEPASDADATGDARAEADTETAEAETADTETAEAEDDTEAPGSEADTETADTEAPGSEPDTES